MTHPTVTVDSYRDITQTTWIEETVWHDGEVPAGEYMLVPVDAVVLSRQPCNNCDGTGEVVDAQHPDSDVAPVPTRQCGSCGGSGTTWPYEIFNAVADALSDATGWEAQRVLDAIALAEREQ